jgi:cell division inhibitor SepF
MSIKNRLKSLFSVDDEYEYEEEEQEEKAASVNKPTAKGNQNVVRLESVQSTSKVVLSEPKDFDGVQEIADHLKNRRAVVINLQRVDRSEAKRIVDFLSGTVYAIGGNIQKLGQQTFLFAPDNIDISGTISELEDTI